MFETIIGTEFNDDLFGTSGADFIDGLGGDDFILAYHGNDTVYGESGNDYIDGGWGDDDLFGEAGNDIILGDLGDDDLFGGLGNDYLDGEAGADYLYGGGEVLDSKELDTLTGGLGPDVFFLGDMYGAYYEDSFGLGEASYATITDFNALEGDQIQVFGSIDDYSLETFAGGLDIFYKGDLIAFVQNTTDVVPSIDFVFV